MLAVSDPIVPFFRTPPAHSMHFLFRFYSSFTEPPFTSTTEPLYLHPLPSLMNHGFQFPSRYSAISSFLSPLVSSLSPHLTLGLVLYLVSFGYSGPCILVYFIPPMHIHSLLPSLFPSGFLFHSSPSLSLWLLFDFLAPLFLCRPSLSHRLGMYFLSFNPQFPFKVSVG